MTGSAGVFAGRMDAAPEGRLNFAQYGGVGIGGATAAYQVP